ncbi:MAG TPA: ABC transporter permease [Balneolales bacterium]|nr:ABC transporter permease [Balneolales bacterium]
MLLNYLKISIRHFYKNKLFSLINITGLSLGLASFLFLFLIIFYQFSFDRFNKKASRIYRMTTETKIAGNSSKTAYTPALLSSALKKDFPEISKATRLSRVQSAEVVVHNETFYAHNFYWADPDLFHIFTFKILRGNRSDLLSHPNSIVISQKAAWRYFSKNENPVDRRIKMGGKEFIVSGVFRDLPSNSHFHPRFIASYQALTGRTITHYSQSDKVINLN